MKFLSQYLAIIQNLPEPIFTCDKSGYIKTYNEAALNLWGKKPTIGKDLWYGSCKTYDCSGASMEAESCSAWQALQQKKPVQGKEIILKSYDGTLKHINPFSAPLFDANGRLKGAINMLHLVKKTMDWPGKPEAGFLKWIEHTPDAVFLISFQGKILAANNSGCTMLGYTNEELLQLSLDEIVPLAYVGKMLVDPVLLRNGYSQLVERKFMKRNGTVFYAELNVQATETGNIQATVRDITDRKSAEKKMLDAVQRYEILSRAISDTIWDWDICNNTVMYNHAITQMFGYAAGTAGKSISWWEDHIHPEDRDAATAAVENIFANQLENFQMQYRFRCIDNSYKHIFERFVTLFDEEGNATRMIGAMQDITERMDAEEKINRIKNDITEHKFQVQKKITRAIIKAQENERMNMGQELHDNVNQLLTAANLHLSLAAMKDKKIEEAISYPMQIITECINEIKLITAKNFIPANNINLQELTEQLLAGISKQPNIQVSLHFDLSQTPVDDDDLKLNIFRILQEQASNMMKYAAATKFDVSVTGRDNQVYICTRDDGQGFELSSRIKGNGVSSIRSRVESFNGEVRIQTAPGKGCAYEIIIPIK